MTSTSSEPVVLRGVPDTGVADAPTGGDLRAGAWTRLGGASVFGDPVTESLLGTLAEQTRAAARAEGYAAGWAEGRRRAVEESRAALDEHAARLDADRAAATVAHERVLHALGEAAAHCEAEIGRRSAELAHAAVDLALAIAEEVVGRELELAREPGLDALRRAVAAEVPDARVAVRLHPQDLATLDPESVPPTVTLRPDATLTPGDAVAETDGTVVDATIAGALDRVRAVLGR